MFSALRGRNPETTIFNCARPQQHMPMRLSCGGGKGRRNTEQLSTTFCQCAVEVRKAQIITNGQSYATPGKIGCYRLCAGCNRVRFPIAFTGRKIDIEQM